MKTRFLGLLVGALLACWLPTPLAHAQQAFVLSNCGTPNTTLTAGTYATPFMDTTGRMCGSSSGSVTATVASTAGTATAKGGTITVGGTSQTIIASNSSRIGFIIQNPCSAAEQGISIAEDLVINITSAATLTTSANLAVLAPCASFSMGLNYGVISTAAITGIATTTGHIFYAKEF